MTADSEKLQSVERQSVLINYILVDPARGYCYQGLTKPCESRGERPRHTAQ